MSEEVLVKKCKLTPVEINEAISESLNNSDISIANAAANKQFQKDLHLIASEIRKDYHSWLSDRGYTIVENEVDEYWERWEK